VTASETLISAVVLALLAGFAVLLLASDRQRPR
jgi:hypothetical protein